jgi:cobalt-zinc-cadmium efflux system membrane fusion protein
MAARFFSTPFGIALVTSAAGVAALFLGIAAIYWVAGRNVDQANAAPAAIAAPADDSVEISDSQSPTFKIAPAGYRDFTNQKTAIGSIDYNEDMSVQVFPNYQGKILSVTAQLGDDVKKGDMLYTIDSPDLIAAESNLIGAAATLALTNAALERAKVLYPQQGIAQKDYDQAVSDQQTAEGALKAARNAVLVFGKTDVELDRIIATRQIDPTLVVLSPISGRITARNAQPGLLAQPGTTPAPYTVSDLSTKWMLAYVPESDSRLYHDGQEVEVTVTAAGRIFRGKITTMGTNIDPNTHRITIRSVVRDPQNELRPGMLANFITETAAPETSLGVPVNGVVREGDGTMTVWVTTDRRHFAKKVVTVGIQQDGYDQILSGLNPGDQVVTDGAVFMSNIQSDSPG